MTFQFLILKHFTELTNFHFVTFSSFTEVSDLRSLFHGIQNNLICLTLQQDLRKMRAKSKSWSGGTIARTSRMGRLNL